MIPSLVLITVDCLRADHVGFLGYQRPTTPFLDVLAQESLVFHEAVAAGVPTYHAFPGIMASRYPLALGRDVVGLAPDEPTLASVLRQAGYTTAAFIAGNPYLSRHFGYDHGFDRFEDFLDAEIIPLPPLSDDRATSWRSKLNRGLRALSHKFGPLGRFYDDLYFEYAVRRSQGRGKSLDQLRRFPAADVVVDRASRWLIEQQSTPFFLWLHLMDPHGPYYPTQQALELMGERRVQAARAHYLNHYWGRNLEAQRLWRFREEMIALYDAGIRWVDAQLARLAEILRRQGLWDNCLFVLTADHGEEFLEHRGTTHFPPKVTQELIHVPLLLRTPGMRSISHIRAPFCLINLAPTLVQALDLPIASGFRGREQWTTLQREHSWGPTATECCSSNPCVSSELGQRSLAVREGQYKLVFDLGLRQEQLFDLNKDPAELHPLPLDVEKPVRRRLLERARQHVADSWQLCDSRLRVDLALRDLRHRMSGEVKRVVGND